MWSSRGNKQITNKKIRRKKMSKERGGTANTLFMRSNRIVASKKKLTNFFHYVNMFMGKPNKVKPLFLKNLLHNHKRVGLIPTLLVS